MFALIVQHSMEASLLCFLLRMNWLKIRIVPKFQWVKELEELNLDKLMHHREYIQQKKLLTVDLLLINGSMKSR